MHLADWAFIFILCALPFLFILLVLMKRREDRRRKEEQLRQYRLENTVLSLESRLRKLEQDRAAHKPAEPR
jgi:hypothetical protein